MNWQISNSQYQILKNSDKSNYNCLLGSISENINNINIYNNVDNNAWLPQINHSKLALLLSGDLSDLAINLSSQGALAFTSESTINLLDENLFL